MGKKGFTLIEIMVVVAIGAIVTLIVLGAVGISRLPSDGSDGPSYGINGITESRCIGGYKYVVDGAGGATQVLNELGKGVTCQ